MTFTGSQLGGWTRNVVTWDAMLGTTQQERSVQSLQLYKEGQGDFPFSEVISAAGYDDPQAIIDKGRSEMLERKQLEAQMGPPPGQGPQPGGDPNSAAKDQMSLAGGGAGGAPPGGPPVQPGPPSANGNGGGMPNFAPIATPPTQPGLGTPAPTPDILATIRQVLATLSLRGTADVEISGRGYVVEVSDYRDVPAVKKEINPVAAQLGITITVKAAAAARS
jgi:hypothetical protein